MYIYNVTTNIDEALHDEWLHWMREEHIPEILATGKFSNARILRVLVEEEMGGITYSVQYIADRRDMLEKYYKEDAAAFDEKARQRFGDHMVVFRTELQVVSEH
ncbi:DUF4286 family protein [Sinomicrobium soli]|uniref:DUF4286 family protein n=1 Tax=Sinomicrobium sp. N-1-3-6 TaxID=2219864 RepID=UPI000DCDCD42|nr:DUF4286 family protein [Sinomicrobium sp. N-1-3-6]RAV27570.1 DUF4286 domain-containing protein [Sinomicrobium sp. N-1-3-6]